MPIASSWMHRRTNVHRSPVVLWVANECCCLLGSRATSRKHKQAPDAGATVPEINPPVDSVGSNLFRQTLLGWVTALLVARPLVFGEDPGLLTAPTDISTLILTVLWFLVGVGYAGWCLWTKRRFGAFNVVEWGLLLAVLAIFVSSEQAARYKHPARLIFWEWLAYLVIYALIRRVAVRGAERNLLLGALIASAVSLSAYGIYQGFVEMPRDRERYTSNPEELRKALLERNLFVDADDLFVRNMRHRLLGNDVFGTYAQSGSFAATLVLFVPCLLGAIWLGLRDTMPRWHISLMVLALLVTLAALWLTHSQAALFGLFLAALLALGWQKREWLLARKGVLLGLGVVLIIGGVVIAQSRWQAQEEEGLVRRELETWKGTAKMMADRPWWGFGPGNFSNAYPRYMLPGATVKARDPHNFLLEIGSMAGVWALLGLVVALFFAWWRPASERTSEAPDADEPATKHLPPPMPNLRWVFYLGGMAGLLVGFALRMADLPVEMIKDETRSAIGRSLCWFLTFGLLAGVPWTDRLRGSMLLTGAGAMLICLLFISGMNFPSVATLFWASLALAAPFTVQVKPRNGVSHLFPLPGFGALLLFYLFTVFIPVTVAATGARNALLAGRVFMESEAQAILNNQRVNRDKAGEYVRKHVIVPLEKAQRDDPDNAWLFVQLSTWYGTLWAHGTGEVATAERALQAAKLAEALDPEGSEAYFAEFRLRILFARVSETVARQTKEKEAARSKKHREDAVNQYNFAVQVMKKYLPFDPRDPQLRFQLAEVHFLAGDVRNGQLQAKLAQGLNQNLPSSATHSLTEPQVKQIEAWLSPPPAG